MVLITDGNGKEGKKHSISNEIMATNDARAFCLLRLCRGKCLRRNAIEAGFEVALAFGADHLFGDLAFVEDQ